MSRMNFFRRIFASQQDNASRLLEPAGGAGVDAVEQSLTIVPQTVTVETLQQFIPLRHLPKEELQIYAFERKAEVLRAGSFLFRRGEMQDTVMFLLAGSVVLEEWGERHEVIAGTTRARMVLSNRRPHEATAHARTDVQILRIPVSVMAVQFHAATAHRQPLNELLLPPELDACPLAKVFLDAVLQEQLPAPVSLGPVARRLGDAVLLEGGAEYLCRVIQLDPILCGKLLRAASSPLYKRDVPLRTCRDAVERIGTSAVRQFVRINVDGMFARHGALQQRMLEWWKQSLLIANLSAAFAVETRMVEPEQARVVGLLSDLGLYALLRFVDSMPPGTFDETDVETAAGWARAEVGERLLRSWGLPDAICRAVREAENWFLVDGDTLTVRDIVLLARMHAYIGLPRMMELPDPDAVPAYRKWVATTTADAGFRLYRTVREQTARFHAAILDA